MPTLPRLRRFATGELTWTVRADVDCSDFTFLLEAPDRRLQAAPNWLRNDKLITMSRVASGSGRYVLRRLNYGRLRHRLRDVFRASRARRAFMHGLMLEFGGVPTPRALAVAEMRRLWWPIKAYVLTDEVQDCVTLVSFLAKRDARSREGVLATAGLVASLHCAGFSHRDLKQGNILIDSRLKPWIIDLDGVRYHGNISTSRAVADLGVLARDYSRTSNRLRWEGARFLKHYCRRRGLEDRFREFAVGILAEMRRL